MSALPKRFEAMLDDPATSEEVRAVLMELLKEAEHRQQDARNEEQVENE